MATGKNIKATPTSVGFDGTGYFRGNDGKYYYGNPQNGYLKESIQSQRNSAAKEASYQPGSPCPPSPIYDDASAPSGGTILDFILCAGLAIKILFWLFVFGAVFAVLSALFFGTLYSWPFLIKMLIQDFAGGIFDLRLILMAAVLLALLAYFIFCAHTVFTKRISCLKRFLIPGVIVAILLALICSVSGLGFFDMLVTSISLLALPTFLLCFFEHLVTKGQRGDQRWFITRAAKLIAPFFIGKSTGMIVFGAIIAVLGVATIASGELFMPMNLILMGSLLTAMGILSKAK